MTTIDLDTTEILAAAPRPAARRRFTELWMAFWARRAERQVLYALSDMDERLLRDIGIEPMDVRAALYGRIAPSMLFNPMRRRPDHE